MNRYFIVVPSGIACLLGNVCESVLYCIYSTSKNSCKRQKMCLWAHFDVKKNKKMSKWTWFWLRGLTFPRAGWRNAPPRKPTSWGSSSLPPSLTSTTSARSRWSSRWTCWRPLSSCSASTCCTVSYRQKCGHRQSSQKMMKNHRRRNCSTHATSALIRFPFTGAEWRVI